MSLPPMNELLAFQKVAARLSFKQAADELSLTPSTLSHLVRSLEERLKTRLLNRTTRSVALTESGQKLFNELRLVLENLNQVLNNAEANTEVPSGAVRISVNKTAAPILLSRLTPDFFKAFPDVRVELTVDNRIVDIVAEGFDAGVRLYDSIPKDMIAVPILKDFRFVTVASPKYLKKHGSPQTPLDLEKHNCIGFRFESGRLYDWEFARGAKKITIATKGSLSTNDPRLLIDAAKSGLGIAYVAESLIFEELAAKELVPVLKSWKREWPGLYLYYPKNRYLPPALRVTVDALKV